MTESNVFPEVGEEETVAEEQAKREAQVTTNMRRVKFKSEESPVDDSY
jgi:hypothetical protein